MVSRHSGHESSVDDPFPLDPGFLKVDQKGQSQLRSLEIINALRHMLIREALHTFQFDQELVLNNHVGHILTHTLPFICNRVVNLALEIQPTQN